MGGTWKRASCACGARWVHDVDGGPHWVPRYRSGGTDFLQTLYALGPLLALGRHPRDSMGCIDNIQHPKPTQYGTYKLHSCVRHARWQWHQAGSETTIAIYARAPSSTATAACGAPHGIMRGSARTIRTLRAASACDVAIAHTGPATTAMPPRHVRNRTRKRRTARRARRRRRRARRQPAG